MGAVVWQFPPFPTRSFIAAENWGIQRISLPLGKEGNRPATTARGEADQHQAHTRPDVGGSMTSSMHLLNHVSLSSGTNPKPRPPCQCGSAIHSDRLVLARGKRGSASATLRKRNRKKESGRTERRRLGGTGGSTPKRTEACAENSRLKVARTRAAPNPAPRLTTSRTSARPTSSQRLQSLCGIPC